MIECPMKGFVLEHEFRSTARLVGLYFGFGTFRMIENEPKQPGQYLPNGEGADWTGTGSAGLPGLHVR